MKTQNSAFTFIEMAIVIVIIGLIVGGIVMGRDIIKNAQLQSAISDVNDFKSATKLFKEKYKYMPGDFPDAVAMWGQHASGCPNINTTGTTNTCNGDGDGFASYNATPLATVTYENYLVWKHLQNAGLIKIKYDGNGYGRAASKAGSAAFYTFYYASPANTNKDGYFAAKYNHIISLGAKRTSSDYGSNNAAFTGVEALNIDQKVDDGKPGTGVVLSFTTTAGSPTLNCASGATYAATYNISSASTPNCSLIFITGF
jgi:type II secretory pathway pseudopilin PulG